MWTSWSDREVFKEDYNPLKWPTIYLHPTKIPMPILIPTSPTQLQPLITPSQSKTFKPHTPFLQLPFATNFLQQTRIQQT